ncbi:pyridoxamine 5'-phosphate oxidase family protein [Roseibium sp.]|uniref:pyridoxamine 5'-phosphate oxidase family protein n=1 Tax=Roseibium sp. TaxID=1936156 RepID=UPI003A976BA1
MPHRITTQNELDDIYGQPVLASTAKVSTVLTSQYRRLVEASPFCALATAGPEGLDCSPRGDASQCLFIQDERTLLMPDRRGNNRIDSLRNIVRDPRVALLLLIPGAGSTLRINGRAELTAAPALLARLAMKGQQPRTVIVITIEEIYFQCARAVLRAGLWNQEAHVEPKSLPTPGDILADMSNGKVGGKQYDEDWPERAAKTMW